MKKIIAVLFAVVICVSAFALDFNLDHVLFANKFNLTQFTVSHDYKDFEFGAGIETDIPYRICTAFSKTEGAFKDKLAAVRKLFKKSNDNKVSIYTDLGFRVHALYNVMNQRFAKIGLGLSADIHEPSNEAEEGKYYEFGLNAYGKVAFKVGKHSSFFVTSELALVKCDPFGNHWINPDTGKKEVKRAPKGIAFPWTKVEDGTYAFTDKRNPFKTLSIGYSYSL